ncbi:MAG: hypothetical protein J6S21_03170, partial [Victivallales bacterium]|nr:hypothetical protein [Victivallales bacterium]
MYRYGHFGFIFLLLLLLCGMPMTAQEKVSVVRRLHYVSTDKPVYRPGEKIFFRDVLLDAFSNYPVENADIPAPVLTITGPRGEEIFNGTATVQHSAASFIWEIPGNISGGIYKVRFSEVGKDNGSSGERSFEIRSYRVPRMRTQVDFARRGYLPGEECVAVLNFSRSEGGVPADARVTVMAVLDGKVILEPTPVAHNAGCAQAKFKLPAEIADGDGTVQFTIEDGGIVESAALTIPVLLDNYDVFFYPESGPLVTGISNRIYVEALHKNGKGADFSGEILCGDKTVARVSTGHDGRGVFELTPEAGCVYRLRITNAAAGTHREFNLPVSENGAQLRSDRQTYPFDAPVTFQVNVSPAFSGQVGKVVLRKRDGELSSVEVKDDNARVTLPAGEAEGVLTATLYGRDGAPLAERLIFREPRFRVQMQIAGADRQYTPGEKVKLRITATDGKGGIMGGVNVGITVVDDSVLQMVQRREQAPRLPEMVYLENEVLHFADAAEFFRSRDGRGAERIDLLLGTQGWRRFVLERREQIGEKYPDQVARILGNPVKPMDVLRRNRRNGMLKFKAMGAVNDAVEMMPMPIAEAAVAAGVDAAPAAAAVPAAQMVMEAGADIRPNVMAAAPAAKRRIMPAPEIQSWRRIYAHKARGERRPGDRTDFTETVFWCASQRTDPRSGVCEIEFELPDTIGTFRVMADASAPNGALGTGDAEVISVVPFQSEIKFPLFMSVGDIARMPVTLINATAAPLQGVNLALETNGSLELVSKPELPAVIPAGGRIRMLAQVRAVKAGEALIACRAVAGGHTDRVERKFQVVSRHFPFQLSQGGRFEAGKPLIMDAEIPAETENGSQSSLIQVFTSPAATMEAALAALLRKPHGCFEQTSSTNYPLVMAQQYFLSHSGIEPRKITEAGKLLEEGYKKLISFECREKGYEWFGASPAHEALTAYGLME